MSVLRTAARMRRDLAKGPYTSALGRDQFSWDLSVVKSVTFTFNPFDDRSRQIRHFYQYTSTNSKLKATNSKCAVKCNVVTDSTEPHLDITFLNDHTYRVIAHEVSIPRLTAKLRLLAGVEQQKYKLVPPVDEADKEESDEEFDLFSDLSEKKIDPLKMSKQGAGDD